MFVIKAETAIDYAKAGLSVIPSHRKNKNPALPEWTTYQNKIAEPEVIRKWFQGNGLCLSVVTGKVSDNLEMFDFDFKAELFETWKEIVEEEAFGLIERLLIEESQSGGIHVVYRCPETTIPGNTKLAVRSIEADGPEEIEYMGKRFKPRKESDQWFATVTLIETRGEGGQFLCAPSPGYRLLQGSFTDVPVITAAERDVLISAAKSLTEYVRPEKQISENRKGISQNRPGDDFNERGDVVPILQNHGWVHVRTKGNYEHWRRPGKDQGQSATLIDGKTFYVFSSNGSPFEPDKGYSPFAVYTLLEHGGDYSSATKALVEMGYGSQIKKSTTPDSVFNALLDEQVGDARLFIEDQKNSFLYDHAENRFYQFRGHSWEQDLKDNITASCDSVVQRYKREAGRWARDKHKAVESGDKGGQQWAAETEKKYLKRIAHLQKKKYRTDVIHLATAGNNSLGITGDEWDRDPWLLGVRNGVVDLHQGNLRPGKPEDFIRTTCATEWKSIDEHAPNWGRFLKDIFSDKKEIIDYVQRLCGYGCTGLSTEHILPILWGAGRNGKGTFLESIGWTLGKYAGPIQAEMLLKQKYTRSPSAPSPEITDLRGQRIVYRPTNSVPPYDLKSVDTSLIK